MFPKNHETEKTIQIAETIKTQLAGCVDQGEDGELKMTITLPDKAVLDNLARSMARVVAAGMS